MIGYFGYSFSLHALMAKLRVLWISLTNPSSYSKITWETIFSPMHEGIRGGPIQSLWWWVVASKTLPLPCLSLPYPRSRRRDNGKRAGPIKKHENLKVKTIDLTFYAVRRDAMELRHVTEWC